MPASRALSLRVPAVAVGVLTATVLGGNAQAQVLAPSGVLGPGVSSQSAGPSAAGNGPPLQLRGAIDLSQTYTTNARGSGNTSGAKDDTYTRARLNLGLDYDSLRLNARMNYSLSGSYYSRFHRLNNLTNRLNLFGNATLVPDSLFLSVNAFATPVLLSRLGAISASGEPISNFNNRDSYGYTVSPRYLMRLKDYATATTSVSQSGVFFVSPSTANAGPVVSFAPIRNTQSFSASETIQSGTYFGRFRWSLSGSYSRTHQAGLTTKDTSGLANMAYAVSRIVSVLASGGYDDFQSSSPLRKGVAGPVALGGLSISYGPTFRLVAEAGIRNHFPAYVGSLSWNLTPRTSLTGSLTDSLTTPAGDILSNLSLLGTTLGSGGSVAATSYGDAHELALFPTSAIASPFSSNGLALDNSVNHVRRASLSLRRQGLRTSYELSLFGNTRDRLDTGVGTANPNTSLYGGQFLVTRKMRRDLTGYVSVSYSAAKEFGGHDHIVSASTGLNYSLSERFQLYFIGRYLRRDMSGVSSLSSVPLSDTEVVAGLRRNF